MPGQVQIKLGDMFQGACDLIVLPCSTSGTVTQFVFNRLQSYNIPHPKAGLKLGEVGLCPFKGGDNIAQYVAFAVSVDDNYSDLQAIREIGRRVGEITMDNDSLDIVHIPLLGAGAGGLQSEKVAASLKEGFNSSSSSNSVLIIHVLQIDVYNRIVNHFKGIKTLEQIDEEGVKPSAVPLRLFISWTRTDDNHWNWTKNLAKFLRDNGINARIDVWHLRPGMDLPQFMTNELSLADKVLIISNEQYAAKADGRTGGVGWETMIIQGDMSKQPSDSVKYITLVKCDSIDNGLPVYLKSKYVIHWPSNSKESIIRQKLISEILNVSEEPPIGIAPVFL